MNQYVVHELMDSYSGDWVILKVQCFWIDGVGAGIRRLRKYDEDSWTDFGKRYLTEDRGYIDMDKGYQRMVKLGRFLEIKMIDIKIDAGVRSLAFHPFTKSCRHNWGYILGRAVISGNRELVEAVMDHKYDQGELHWSDEGVWLFGVKCAVLMGNWDIFQMVADEVDDVGSKRTFYHLSLFARLGGNRNILDYLDDHRGQWVSAEDV